MTTWNLCGLECFLLAQCFWWNLKGHRRVASASKTLLRAFQENSWACWLGNSVLYLTVPEMVKFLYRKRGFSKAVFLGKCYCLFLSRSQSPQKIEDGKDRWWSQGKQCGSHQAWDWENRQRYNAILESWFPDGKECMESWNCDCFHLLYLLTFEGYG